MPVMYGAHRRLQHSLHIWQSVPSTPPWQNDGPVGGGPHVPTPFIAMLHVPPQHSALALHVSPVWTQNEEPWLQNPFWQRPEQHSTLPPHMLPAVLHNVLSWAHLPALQ